MSVIKISLITVTYNAAKTIEHCLTSVIEQAYPNLEYIIIDGQSTDDTLVVINKYKKYISHIVSEPDSGIYDAMNKGIGAATGDVIGILNADDCFAANDILWSVADAFATTEAAVVYGDINYVNKMNKIIRKWRSGSYKPGHFNFGWMPPHPSFYAKKQLFEQWGGYKPQYGSATDYELMLRFLHANNAPVKYIPRVFVTMLVGGVSNKNFGNRVKAWYNDYKAMKTNGLLFPYVSIILKPLRKIVQYFG